MSPDRETLTSNNDPDAPSGENMQVAFGVGQLPLEVVPCYLCEVHGGDVLVDDPPFKVLQCRSCGLVYTSPRLDGARIHELYEADQYFASDAAESFGYDDYDKDVEAYIRTFRRKFRVVEQHIQAPPARLLEVGTAGGAFLKVAQDKGYEVFGTEISPSMVSAARRRFGFENLQCGTLDQVDLPPETFDVVAMFDVIEHLPNPLHELSLCRKALKPGGTLIIQTQDVSSRTRKMLGKRWQHFKQLEHVYHFNRNTLKELLGRAGFRLKHITKRHAGKYVRIEEIADRANRVCGVPNALVSPLRLLGKRYVYLNPMDELLAFAEVGG